MPQVLWLLLLVLVDSHLVPMPLMAADTALPGTSMCGDVEIPYPFRLSDNGSWQGQFTITCNQSFSPPRPYVARNMEVIDISLETGEMRVFSPVSYTCHNPSSNTRGSKQTWLFSLPTPFLISTTRNVFTAIGCSTQALLQGGANRSYFTGCTTTCTSLDSAARDGDQCTGLGCCQADISVNLATMEVGWNDPDDHPDNRAWLFNPCSYAFVAQKGWYNFSRQDLVDKGGQNFSSRTGYRTIPLVLDWAIVNGSCTSSDANYACLSAHSNCANSPQRDSGYLCGCSKGYEGNPYIIGGCKNINECKLGDFNACGSGSICHDMDGGFECKCKFWYRRDGRSDTSCQRIFSTTTIWTIIAILAVCLLTYWAIVELKKQKQRKIFNKNGGEILKDMGINIFTECELKKVTDGYKKVIGEGAFGKVYKGTIKGAEQVAVKCSFTRSKAPCHDEFRNEIIFQFRINHANVVRLIGCCLETDVPKLVFEFVPNGSLYELLHVRRDQGLSLPTRLHIAIGSAEALFYMHSQGGHNNHVHGDFKSGNILLDNDLTPKVSDFGSSKLVSIVSGYAKWYVSGDMNYIDPTYLKTGRFTEKSDVYSFGVVLLELITRKTAKYDGSNSLTINFVKSCKEEGHGREMYDPEMLMSDDAKDHHYMECLYRIGTLAVQCLKEDVDERPAMAQVLKQLKQVQEIACGGLCSGAS
ncbi:hypothetical protein SEVIR_8G228800v4 [Setaria viridis]|uniref:Protein kinase domain-containing protein n=1 Tax=Setaria viridis TaxID=4556 RepID=A0A4U6TWN5_SETVI|nr:wall-associated receptor kinase 3-like [Setaria viridis]TKW02177.1 hypothetical protein SEVIR_8G228800v2 [Setaria viridis]